ncbi:MAG: P-II family nitrogen regulator, partial [Aureliella sp.]
MKLVLAIIQPTKLQAVREALRQAGVERMTVCDAQGYGRQRGQVATYRGIEYQVNMLRKIAVEIWVNDDFIERTVDILLRVAKT